MHTFDFLQNKIEQALNTQNFKLEPKELYQPVSYTINIGGKRMRPVLVLMACDLFSGNLDAAVMPALGVELFHNFTLIHDDIMDKSPLRRGKQTVYRKWNTDIALLSGDAMFAIAYKYIAKTDKEHLQDVLNVFNQTAVQVCEGQQYDMNFETIPHTSIQDYLNMIKLKTGVLIAASLKIGAIIADADKKDADNIYQFGENIGIAFQLKDDILDVFGNEKTFGKKTGNDIVTNKKTYLYIKAFELVTKNNLHILSQAFANTDAKVKVKTVKEIYEHLKVKDIAEKEMQHYYNKALKHLAQIKTDDKQKAELRLFTDKLMVRDF